MGLGIGLGLRLGLRKMTTYSSLTPSRSRVRVRDPEHAWLVKSMCGQLHWKDAFVREAHGPREAWWC